jgi:hypothetical protein
MDCPVASALGMPARTLVCRQTQEHGHDELTCPLQANGKGGQCNVTTVDNNIPGCDAPPAIGGSPCNADEGAPCRHAEGRHPRQHDKHIDAVECRSEDLARCAEENKNPQHQSRKKQKQNQDTSGMAICAWPRRRGGGGV